jgi:hypothetical protein
MKARTEWIKKLSGFRWSFYIAELLIALVIFYFIFRSKSEDALSFAELLFTIGYALLIRVKIRPLLAIKWKYFHEKPSAPYTLTFMGLLLFCAFLLIFKLEPIAEQLANIAYIILVIAVGIEFYLMIKNRRSGDDGEE